MSHSGGKRTSSIHAANNIERTVLNGMYLLLWCFGSFACQIPENGADVAHLDTVHGAFIFDFLPMMKHTW